MPNTVRVDLDLFSKNRKTKYRDYKVVNIYNFSRDFGNNSFPFSASETSIILNIT